MDYGTAVKDLEVGNVIQGNGEIHSEWEIIACHRPFNEGITYHVEFQNVDTGEILTRYIDEYRRYTVLR